MFNILLNCIVCATMLSGGYMDKNIQQYLIQPSQAYVIVDNNYYRVEEVENFNEVMLAMLRDSHTMPAFGVSIHAETLNAIRNGVWVKLQYNGTQYVDEMPFDELLIQVEQDYNGFNVIRGNRGVYDGRCYYIDLVGNTMTPLYEYIIQNFKN